MDRHIAVPEPFLDMAPLLDLSLSGWEIDAPTLLAQAAGRTFNVLIVAVQSGDTVREAFPAVLRAAVDRAERVALLSANPWARPSGMSKAGVAFASALVFAEPPADEAEMEGRLHECVDYLSDRLDEIVA